MTTIEALNNHFGMNCEKMMFYVGGVEITADEALKTDAWKVVCLPWWDDEHKEPPEPVESYASVRYRLAHLL